MRFSVNTLGCKANQYDTGTIISILTEKGHEHVRTGDGCDVCIINTCAVTAESVRKSRQAVRKMKKLEPGALIAVCGCHAKLDSNEIALTGVDLIGGTSDREEFTDRIIKATALKTPAQKTCIKPTIQTPPAPRTRALLKIQDGCDNYCTYCIIPYARGKSRSMPIDEIAGEAQKLQEQGYKEIVVTGIEISSWGKDLPSAWHRDYHSVVLRKVSLWRALGTNPTSPHDEKTILLPLLIAAIRTISTNAPNTRLHLGSLDPQILTDDFIHELATITNLCNHFHISLQSGCDEILDRMGRAYKTSEILKSIKQLRSKFDNCAVTADLITGFPGETDEQHEKTLQFIKKAAFSSMHIFPYSKRPGTAAETMPNQIEQSIKQQRAKEAKQIAEQMKSNFLQTQIGKTVQVLFEEQKGKYSVGHADNYTKVTVISKIDKNTIKNVTISSIKDDILFGKIV